MAKQKKPTLKQLQNDYAAIAKECAEFPQKTQDELRKRAADSVKWADARKVEHSKLLAKKLEITRAIAAASGQPEVESDEPDADEND